MKKTLLFAAAALVMTVGCSKTETTPEVISDAAGQIGFSTFVNTNYASKALVTGTKYDVNETFGTFAYFTANNTTFPKQADVYIPESEVSNTTKATSGAVWKTAATYYWPKTGKLAFFSYSPYDELNAYASCTANQGIIITGWDVDANQGVDVMVADPKLDQTANGTNDNYTGVPTIFRHKLAQVVGMTIKTAKDYSNNHTEATAQVGDKFFAINSITINGVNYKGTYTEGNTVGATTEGWVPTTDAKNYIWYTDTTGQAFGSTKTAVTPNQSPANAGQLLVLPQKFNSTGNDDAEIVVTYTIKTCTGVDGGGNRSWFSEKPTVELNFSSLNSGTGSEWAQNYKYTYNFTVDLEKDIIYWAPSVEEWTTDSFDLTI